MDNKKGLPIKLSKLAQRAMANAGVHTIEQLTRFTESELAGFHGITKNSLINIKKAMDEMRLS